ncbi:MAG: YIP1 family protein [Acidobacteriota bacterium]
MNDSVFVRTGPGLSQGERVVDTFLAPSKTFTDILRSSSWWLPLVIMAVFTMASGFAIGKKVGWDAVAEQQMTKSPTAADRFEQMPPDQRTLAVNRVAKTMPFFTYGAFVIILIFVALHALLLWASFNFGLGAKTSFGQVFAVIMYAGLPKLFISLLTIILLFAGVGTDGFVLDNPVGTNLGYFLPSTMPALKAAGSFIDVFGLWSLALLVIGMAIISKKKIGSSAMVVVGWWVVGMLLAVGAAAVFG